MLNNNLCPDQHFFIIKQIYDKLPQNIKNDICPTDDISYISGLATSLVFHLNYGKYLTLYIENEGAYFEINHGNESTKSKYMLFDEIDEMVSFILSHYN